MKIIAYHWSPERFEKFDNAYIGSTNSSTYLEGFYFANVLPKGTEGYIYKCELTINNPIEIDVRLSDWDSLGVQEAIRALTHHGDWGYIKDYLVDNEEMDVEEAYTLLEQWEQADGAILTNVSYDWHTIEYIVFDASQIKILERIALEEEQDTNIFEALNKAIERYL